MTVVNVDLVLLQVLIIVALVAAVVGLTMWAFARYSVLSRLKTGASLAMGAVLVVDLVLLIWSLVEIRS